MGRVSGGVDRKISVNVELTRQYQIDASIDSNIKKFPLSPHHSNDPKLLTSDNSDCNPSQKDKLTDDENDNDTGNGGSGDNSKDSSKDTI